MSDFPVQPSAANINVPRERVIRIPAVGFRGQLTGSAAVLFTAPTINANLPIKATDLATACIKSIFLTNNDTVSHTVTLYCVETGGSVADNRTILKDLSIATKTTVEYTYDDDVHPLASNETVQGLADTTLKVTVRMGVQILAFVA